MIALQHFENWSYILQFKQEPQRASLYQYTYIRIQQDSTQIETAHLLLKIFSYLKYNYYNYARSYYRYILHGCRALSSQSVNMKNQHDYILKILDFTLIIQTQVDHVLTLETRYLAYKLQKLKAYTRFCLALYASVSKSLLARFYRTFVSIVSKTVFVNILIFY
ncbi:Hypothetical_protein [Hexamita inflata]|uniref:Hypothetical_protein n=1 Tax=Hexamita inflata TaxID=28002 RepID=A0AA86QC32_9EUKA|nr:Hypothetical protein HINF_LOCUS43971 [Hexamita inflata]